MNRQVYNRYDDFYSNGEFKIIPTIEIPIKSTDKYHTYIKSKDRLDRLSQHFYNSPTFGWLIMLANPSVGLNEFEITDNSILRIPFPLIESIQDYKKNVEIYKLYYGE